VIPTIEKEIKVKEHTIKTISGIFDVIYQTTHSEEQAKQRPQLKWVRSTTINRSKAQGPEFIR